jgi:uncharacterized protein (UPF0332 family)
MQPEYSPSDLATFRLEQARECLQNAELSIAADSFKAAANRSYYCIFHAMRAVLALESFDSKRHSGVISQFHKNYIKTGVFSKKYSKVIDYAFEIRNDSDYQDMYLVAKKDVVTQLENAKMLLADVEKYVLPKLQEIEKSK